jgi:hypothetical protein
MTLDLTPEDARMLAKLLRDYLPQLQREESHTEVKALRHELVLREELCERLMERLAAAS